MRVWACVLEHASQLLTSCRWMAPESLMQNVFNVSTNLWYVDCLYARLPFAIELGAPPPTNPLASLVPRPSPDLSRSRATAAR